MGRPVHADAEATKMRILESARFLFADVGRGEASIRDVAARAGVSLAMVHHYFGSKDDLFAACIETVYVDLAAMRAELEAALAATGSPAELLERGVVTAYRFARAHHVAVRLLVRTTVGAGELSPRARELLLTFLDGVSEGLAAVTGRTAHELRLPLQSIVFLVARYAVSAEGELGQVAGTSARMAHARVERHLVDTVHRLLLAAPARN